MLFWIPGLYHFVDEPVGLESFSFFTLNLKSSNLGLYKFFFKTVVSIKNPAKNLTYPTPFSVQICASDEQAYC